MFSLGKRQEIPQQLEAVVLAFFWVELRGDQVTSNDGSGKRKCVVAGGGNVILIRWLWVVGVHEVEKWVFRHVLPNRVTRIGQSEGVPSHVRDFQAYIRKAFYGSG